MGRLYLDFDEGVPQYVFTGCSRCGSLMGSSLNNIKNRGCCSYFPEFYLIDVHRMSKTLEGLHTLENILRHPGAVVHPYHIHVKGTFDTKGYEEFTKSGAFPETGDIRDKTVFFRTCPFVKSGQGCTLPSRYRNYVCNMFICDEVLKSACVQETINQYLEERSRYVRWIEWENSSLRRTLQEHGISLSTGFMQAVEILQSVPLNTYQFAQLEPVETTYFQFIVV